MAEGVFDYFKTGLKAVVADIAIVLVYLLFLVAFIPIQYLLNLNASGLIVIIAIVLVKGYVFRKLFGWQ